MGTLETKTASVTKILTDNLDLTKAFCEKTGQDIDDLHMENLDGLVGQGFAEYREILEGNKVIGHYIAMILPNILSKSGQKVFSIYALYMENPTVGKNLQVVRKLQQQAKHHSCQTVVAQVGDTLHTFKVT